MVCDCNVERQFFMGRLELRAYMASEGMARRLTALQHERPATR